MADLFSAHAKLVVVLTEDVLKGIAAAGAVEKKAIRAPGALNEAYDYGSAFSRGIRLEFGSIVVLLISGTASIDDQGQSLHIGDFRSQQRRIYSNIAALLAAEGATWNDVVRTGCYFRDIDRDYAVFNEERTKFFAEQKIDPFPASLGIQTILCRPELLLEMDAVAVFTKASA